MAKISMPPLTEDFTADPSELFFDLAYVFAFSQIVGVVVHHPDWSHVARMALLFILLWLPWQQFTWTANAVPGNSRPVRIFILSATAVSLPMAASISTAFDAGGFLFAVSVSLIFALGVGLMFFGAHDHATVRRSTMVWTALNIPSLALLIVGAQVATPARTWLWALTAVGFVVATYIAGRFEWPLRPGHFAERHGLITIVALGEVIVAIGIAGAEALSEDKLLPLRSIVSLFATGAFASLLWWGYFDRIGPALEYRLHNISDQRQRSSTARTIYTWDHLAIVGGVMLCAAGLEYIALHPGDPVPLASRALIVGGSLIMVAGYDAAVWTAFRAFPYERTIATVVFAALALPTRLPLIGATNGLAVLFTADALMVAAFAAETRRIEHRAQPS